MGIRLNVDADAGPFNRGMGLAQGAMAGFAATITNVALRAVKDLAGGITEFITDTSKVNAITTAFGNFSDSIGVSAEEMIDKLGPATRGLVSDFDLMQITNNAVALGIVENTDQWAEWGRIATAAGRAVGRDTTSALNDISTGLGRMSPLILDNLGITIDMARETQEWAAANDRVAASITEAEKKQLFMNAALEAGRRIADAAGDSNFVLGDRIVQMGIAWDNFRLRMIDAINTSPAVQAAIQGIIDIFTDSGGLSKAMDTIIEQFQTLLPGAMIIFVRAVQGTIGALGLLHGAYVKVQEIANAVGGLLSTMAEGALLAQRNQIEGNIEAWEIFGASLDGSTEGLDKQKEALERVNSRLEMARGASEAFADQFDAAGERGDAFKAIIKNMQDALDDVIVSISGAGKEITILGNKARELGTDVEFLLPPIKNLGLIIGAVPFPQMTDEVIDAGVRAGELQNSWGDLIGEFRTGNTVFDSVLRMFGKLIGSMGSFTTSANTATTASGGFFSSLRGGGGILGALTGPLGGLLLGGIAAAIPLIAKLFGGADENELEARQIKESIEAMLGPMASVQEQSEATTAGVRVSGIVVRDAYLAMGFSISEAEAAMASLANLSKQQPAEARASADAIMEVVNSAAEQMRETGKSLTDLRNDNINAAIKAADEATKANAENLDKQVLDTKVAYDSIEIIYDELREAFKSRPIEIPILATMSASDISELGDRVQRNLRRDIIEAGQ